MARRPAAGQSPPGPSRAPLTLCPGGFAGAQIQLTLPLAGTTHGFDVAVLVQGALLVIGALFSGLERRSPVC